MSDEPYIPFIMMNQNALSEWWNIGSIHNDEALMPFRKINYKTIFRMKCFCHDGLVIVLNRQALPR